MPLQTTYAFGPGVTVDAERMNRNFADVGRKFEGRIGNADLLARWTRSGILFHSMAPVFAVNTTTIFYQHLMPPGCRFTVESAYVRSGLVAGSMPVEVWRLRAGYATRVMVALVVAPGGTILTPGITARDLVAGDLLRFMVLENALNLWADAFDLSVGLYGKESLLESW